MLRFIYHFSLPQQKQYVWILGHHIEMEHKLDKTNSLSSQKLKRCALNSLTVYFLNGIFNIALAVYPILTIQHAVYRFWQYKKSMLLTQILLMNNCKRISNDYLFEYYFCGFEYDIKSFVLENSKLLSTSYPPWLFWYNVYMYQYIFTGSNWKTCITFSLPFMA